MKRHTIELFYDVISPYTWFGFETILRYEARWGVDLRLRPASLQAIMKITSNTPPAMNPHRGRYLLNDIRRSVPRYGVPMRQPSDFFATIFKGSMLPMRFLTALDQENGKHGLTRTHLVNTSINLWKRAYSEDVDILAPESIAEAARKAGLNDDVIKKLLQASTSQAIKDRLKAVTDEAVESGAFGMPWFRVTHAKSGEQDVFFGSDRFDAIAYFLGLRYDGPQPSK